MLEEQESSTTIKSGHFSDEQIHSEKKTVPDPLENVIEGNNRKERYVNFIHKVLGYIWKSDKQSGQYGEYNDDFHRSTRFHNGDISGYTQGSPFGLDPQFMSSREFETAIGHLDTSDYVRVRSVPPQLLNPEISIASAGGSCVIETHGMRTVSEIQTGIKKGLLPSTYLTKTVKRLIDMAPSVTHISGAILGGHGQSIHYIESDMWSERIVDYGIPRDEAYEITETAYQRIHQAVVRRTLLINPQAVVIPVNFDELPLSQAVHDWFTKIGLPYDPHFRVAEVVYTYDGPRQLEFLQNALTHKINYDHLCPKERIAAAKIIQSSHHVRAKQVDHLRWGSMKLPKEVITGQRGLTYEEQMQYHNDYAYRVGVTLFKSVYEAHKNDDTASIAVGFADLPSFGNEVAHESRNVGINFKGKPGDPEFSQSVENQLMHPARLHRNNIDAHLSFLKSYFDNADRTQLRQTLIQAMSCLQNQGQKSEAVNTRINAIRKELSTMSGPSCFPLNDNPFVHHAMQFLWDPDFVIFLRDAVAIQQCRTTKSIDRDKSNKQMGQLMSKIYPKLESYIKYLYGRISYPEKIRNTIIMND